MWINTYRALAPNMLCWGYNASGIGWENGLDAVKRFTQATSVWVELHPAVDDPFSAKL
jgi:aldehyde dehydrogenase (NAD+)